MGLKVSLTSPLHILLTAVISPSQSKLHLTHPAPLCTSRAQQDHYTLVSSLDPSFCKNTIQLLPSSNHNNTYHLGTLLWVSGNTSFHGSLNITTSRYCQDRGKKTPERHSPSQWRSPRVQISICLMAESY